MRTWSRLVLGAAGTVLVLGGCGTTENTTSGGGFQPPDLEAMQELGKAEGKLSVLAWPGYAEDGSTDPDVDWVTPFEKATGCQVTVKTFGTSDESVTLMKTGDYDVVSASGDASLRLIAAGEVEPVNTSLIPNYQEVWPFLKNRPWNTVAGTNYGVPHGWGANLLMYNTEVVDPAPESWGVVFEEKSPYAGKVTAYDSPIYIADAALYLMKHRPELGIEDPYALDPKQLNAAVALLKQQRELVGEYWSDYLKEIQAFKSGDTVVGTTWQVIVNLTKEAAPVKAIIPEEGSTGWSDTWMVAADSEHKNCAYRWLNHIISPEANAQVAEWFGEAPANRLACQQTTDPNHCQTYHADDARYASRIYYWTTPISACLDGRTDVRCTDYADWTAAWTEVKG